MAEGTPVAAPGGQPQKPLPGSRREMIETVIQALLYGAALVSIITSAAILFVLFSESLRFFQRVPVQDFLFGLTWSPNIEPFRYGVIPLVVGTMHIVIGSAFISLPAGLAIGIYLSEYASPRARNIIKPVLEVLAGIPTVVFGYFALMFITPLLRQIFGQDVVSSYNSASGSIVVGIMILPTVASLCEDAFHAVPNSLRQGAYALGATPFEVSTRVVLPAALSGVMAAFILAFSRAIGETMAVTLAAGSVAQITPNPFEPIFTMTAYIAVTAKGENPHDSTAYYTLFAVGLLLFVITLALNLLADRIRKRFREVYE